MEKKEVKKLKKNEVQNLQKNNARKFPRMEVHHRTDEIPYAIKCKQWIQTKVTILKSQNMVGKRQTPVGLQKKGDREKGMVKKDLKSPQWRNAFKIMKNHFQTKSKFNQNLTKHRGRIKIFAKMGGLKISFPEDLKKSWGWGDLSAL